MKSIKIFGIICCLFTSSILIYSCSKMDGTYDHFLKQGENIYLGRVDSAKVFAGKNRVKFRYWSSDPKSTELMVYWSSRADSLLIIVPSKLKSDSVEFIVPNLPEGILSFELVMMNKNLPYKSMPFKLSNRIYGDQFQTSLIDRFIQTKQYDPLTKKLNITWYGTIQNAIGCELLYTGLNGIKMLEIVPSGESTTIIDGVERDLKYRTVYLPEPLSIDTFYTPYKEIPL